MRKITSLTLLIAGFIELWTSVVLYILPAGRVAYWSNYQLMGLSKTQWGDLHITVGTLLLIAAGLHIWYNWKPIVAYLRNKAKQLKVFNVSSGIALIISLYVTVGTLFHLPPMNYVLQLGESMTNRGNEKYGEPPYGHAELSSLDMFCTRMNIDLETAVNLLSEAGIAFSGPKESMAEIAAANGKTPQQIYEIINLTGTGNDGNAPFPESPPPGFGRKTLREICTTYALSLDEVLSELRQTGYTIDPDDSIKTIGADNDSNSMEVFEVIKKVSSQSR